MTECEVRRLWLGLMVDAGLAIPLATLRACDEEDLADLSGWYDALIWSRREELAGHAVEFPPLPECWTRLMSPAEH